MHHPDEFDPGVAVTHGTVEFTDGSTYDGELIFYYADSSLGDGPESLREAIGIVGCDVAVMFCGVPSKDVKSLRFYSK